MAQAAKGDTVKVHYTGKLADGSVFDSSQQRGPLEFTLGQGQLLSGFEQAVEGMQVGQSTTAQIAAADAYGERDEQQVIQVPREQLPQDLNPEVGQRLRMQGQNGQDLVVNVTAVNEAAITLDANHPLAGEDLTFEIELVEISAAGK